MSGLLRRLLSAGRGLAPGMALLALAAWLRVVWTGSLKVDENFVEGIRAVVVVALVLAGLALAWRSADGAVQTSILSGPLFPAALLAWLCPPFLSNDVFSYFYYGEALRAGLPIYESFDGRSLAWFPYVGQRYLTTPAVYGLPLVSLYAFLDWLAGSDPRVAIGLLKGVHALAWIALFRALEQRFAAKPTNWLGAALPLLMVEGLGNLHNEFLLLAPVVWALVLLERRRYGPAFLLLGLAAWCKLSFGLLFLWPFFQTDRPFTFARLWAGLGLALALLGAAAWGAWQVLFPEESFLDGFLGPIKTVSALGPSSSLSDVVFTLARLMAGEAEAHRIQSWLGKALQLLAIGFLAWLFRYPENRKNPRALWLTAVVFVCFFSHRIMAWYFLMLVPLWWPGLPPVWQRWFAAITALYMAQGLIQYTHPDLLFTKALTGLLVGLGVVWLMVNFRKRFMEANPTP